MNFAPRSILLNNVYIPLLIEPTKIAINLSELRLEQDSNGVNSIIDLSILNANQEYEAIVPFINLSKYDAETKEWFWYDISGFPFRREYDYDDYTWSLTSAWGISAAGGYTNNLYINPELTFFDRDSSQELGLALFANTLINWSGNFYQGNPLVVTIDNSPLKDLTDYSTTSTPSLTSVNQLANPEFYYNLEQNKIITNQNLSAYDPLKVQVRCYTMDNSVSLKCSMSANGNGDSNVSPVVDYYIIKLNGQSLRG